LYSLQVVVVMAFVMDEYRGSYVFSLSTRLLYIPVGDSETRNEKASDAHVHDQRVHLRGGAWGLFDHLMVLTSFDALGSMLATLADTMNSFNSYFYRNLFKVYIALFIVYFPVFLAIGLICGVSIMSVWLALWSVRKWLTVIVQLPFHTNHLVALIIQLVVTSKILEVLYTFALVVFHYGDELTDVITIAGWWGWRMDYATFEVHFDRDEQQSLFAYFGTFACVSHAIACAQRVFEF
jgi:hypothetical protein